MTQHANLPDAGITPHHVLDQVAQDHAERNIKLRVATDDVTNPPTDAELDAAFGTPAEVGAGFVCLLDDDGAGSNVYLVASDGSGWWYVGLTVAV